MYQRLRETKPEYGSNRRIQIKLVDGEGTVTNVHVGSLGDILTYFLWDNIDITESYAERSLFGVSPSEDVLHYLIILSEKFTVRGGHFGRRSKIFFPRTEIREF